MRKAEEGNSGVGRGRFVRKDCPQWNGMFIVILCACDDATQKNVFDKDTGRDGIGQGYMSLTRKASTKTFTIGDFSSN